MSNFFSNTISVKYFTSISPTCHNAQIYNTRSLGAPRLLLYYEVGMSLLKPIFLPSWFARGIRPEGKYKVELKEQITTFYQNFMIFSRKYFFPGSTVFKFATEQLSKIGGWATRLLGNFQIQFWIADALDFCILDLWRRSFLCATWYLWLACQHISKKSIQMQLLFTGLLIHFCNFAQAFYPESSLHRPPMMQINYQRRNHWFMIFQLWNEKVKTMATQSL